MLPVEFKDVRLNLNVYYIGNVEYRKLQLDGIILEYLSNESISHVIHIIVESTPALE
ncbi:9952_t:CDS:1, partial [Entrophospora sp. SA101]